MTNFVGRVQKFKKVVMWCGGVCVCVCEPHSKVSGSNPQSRWGVGDHLMLRGNCNIPKVKK